MHRGWTKSWRKRFDHPLYKYPLVWHYFDFCIGKANIEDKDFFTGKEVVKIKRGSFVTSLDKASENTGLSFQNIRSAQKKLEKLSMISKKSTNRFTVITVCNYDSYQSSLEACQQASNKQVTSNQQTDNKRVTTTKELKNKRTKELKNKTITTPVGAGEKDSEKLSEFFEKKIWPIYPSRNRRKLGKKEAGVWFKKNISLEEAPNVEQAVKNYAESQQIPRDCIRFLRGLAKNKDWDWRDWVEKQERGGESGGIGSNGGYGKKGTNSDPGRWGPQAEVDLPPDFM